MLLLSDWPGELKKKKEKSEDGSAVFKRLREGVAVDHSNSYSYMILSVWVHNIDKIEEQ